MDPTQDIYFEFEPAGRPRACYLICSIPRSGSTLLCALLTRTGVAGAPNEFFHPDYMRMLKQRWNVETTDDYRRELLERKTSPNGVFGVKAHWGQYVPAFGEVDPRDLFPDLRVVFMTRRDRLRQAVSWVRALQTLQWSSRDREREDRPATFDAEDITRKLGRVEREEEMWSALFDRYAIDAHKVVYEDLVGETQRVLGGLLDFIGVEPDPDRRLEAPTPRRQGDELSEQWVERYLAETAGA